AVPPDGARSAPAALRLHRGRAVALECLRLVDDASAETGARDRLRCTRAAWRDDSCAIRPPAHRDGRATLHAADAERGTRRFHYGPRTETDRHECQARIVSRRA